MSSKEAKTTPILLLTGYLGSGKTTLVNNILANQQGIRFAVIVNDIGEVNIDASLIQRGGVVTQQDDSLVALQNGCICCTLKMDLIQQIDDIMKMRRFDYIVIEASGICEPAPIAQTICSMPYMDKDLLHGEPRLDCIVTVVDALRMRDEFASGSALKKENLDEEDIENLIIQQIEFCNIVLLNKASEVSNEDLAKLRVVVLALQPQARIIECDYCDIDLREILDTHLFNFGEVAGSATWIKELERPIDEIEREEEEHHHHHHHEHGHDHEHDEDHEHHHHHDHDHVCDEHCGCHHHHHHHDGEGEAEEYGIGTFVYYRRPAFDLNKFDHFVGTQWPSSVIRAKGICYFKQNPDMSYLFEQAGRQKSLKEAGQWYATAPEEELAQFMAAEPGLAKEWDPIYGDRMEKIVFIGRNMDRSAITAALDACLEK